MRKTITSRSLKLAPFCILILTFLFACQSSSLTVDKPGITQENNAHNIETSKEEVESTVLQERIESEIDLGELFTPKALSPDLVFQTGTELRNSLSCTQLDGEIWRIDPPYHQAELILSHSETAYLQPTWSPDGQWIAYWQSEPSDVPPEDDGDIVWEFQEDSIWLMRPDGQERRQLLDSFIRSNPTGLVNTCRTTGGILKIIGWSQNSQWLAFLVSPEKSIHIKPNLYLVNVNTGEVNLLSDIVTAKWMFNSNTLVGLNEKSGVVEIVNADTEISISSLPIPEDVQEAHILSDMNFVENTNALWIVTRPRGNSYNKPRSLWVVDIMTNEWQLQRDIHLSDNFGGFFIIGDFALFCKPGDGTEKDILEIRSLPSGELFNTVESHCNSAKYMFADMENGWVGSFSSDIQKSIQVSNLQTFITKTLIEWEETNISNPREIASFDWFPINIQIEQ